MTSAIWYVPRDIINGTAETLKDSQVERFVLWTAAISDTEPDVIVRDIVVPAQTAYTGPDGAWVHIDGVELARIAFLVYDNGERAVAQLHTHPNQDVRMSPLDRVWEVVSHEGALSIIVPDHARCGLDGFPGANVYERGSTSWRLWSPDELVWRLVITI
jgi:hypothetical protein